LRKKRQRGWGVRRKREKGRKRHGGRHWERESGPWESKGCAEGAEVQHIQLPANRQKSAKSRNGTLLNRVISGGKAPSSPTSSPTTSSPMPRSNVSHLDLISNHFIFSPSLVACLREPYSPSKCSSDFVPPPSFLISVALRPKAGAAVQCLHCFTVAEKKRGKRERFIRSDAERDRASGGKLPTSQARSSCGTPHERERRENRRCMLLV